MGVYRHLHPTMPVNLGKYSAYIVFFCEKTFVQCAEILCSLEIYLYECANIYLTAQKFLSLHRNI